MGTRNLTCVYLDGEYRVAQYCQWDGYPSGQGATILGFLSGRPTQDRDTSAFTTDKSKYGIQGILYHAAVFKRCLKKCKFISNEELAKRWASVGVTGEWCSIEQTNAMEKLHPQLCRNIGALVLPYIQQNGGVELANSIGFSGDSLFCEWGYVVDYDTNQFEVYKGFVKTPHEGGRFSEYAQKPKHREEAYYPIQLIKAYNLDSLPTEEEFLKDLKEE